MIHPRLTVRAVHARAVMAPMNRPLVTSRATMTATPFLLVDLQTEEGVTGCAHAYCYLELAAPMMQRVLERAGELIAGEPVEPALISRQCRSQFALLGAEGVVGMALSALDVACWDALAKAAELPLGRYLGGSESSVPAYNSNGLGLSFSGADSSRIAEEAGVLLANGFNAIKIRLGRDDPGDDLSAVRAARAAIPPGALLMSDYNQALSVPEAIRRGRVLDDEGLYWIEEPVAHQDLAGSSEVAEALVTPVQIGENFSGPDVLANAIAMNATDCVMFDVMRIGGVSGWLRAAELAAEVGLPVSSHLYPEISAHLLCATPTGHWLEYVDWAEAFITAPVCVQKGQARVPSGPGSGVIWDEDAVSRYAIG